LGVTNVREGKTYTIRQTDDAFTLFTNQSMTD